LSLEPRFDGRNVRQGLIKLAGLYLDIILDERNISFFRIVVAEAARCPRIGVLFYESAILGTATPIARLLAEMSDEAALDIGDSVAAAHQFMALVQGRLHRERLCNVTPAPSAKERDKEIARAVDTFLAAFGGKAEGAF